MPEPLSQIVKLALPCPKCGNKSDHTVASLVGKSTITCTCGASIDLKTAENRALIEKFADFCAQLDVPARKLK